ATPPAFFCAARPGNRASSTRAGVPPRVHRRKTTDHRHSKGVCGPPPHRRALLHGLRLGRHRQHDGLILASRDGSFLESGEDRLPLAMPTRADGSACPSNSLQKDSPCPNETAKMDPAATTISPSSDSGDTSNSSG